MQKVHSNIIHRKWSTTMHVCASDTEIDGSMDGSTDRSTAQDIQRVIAMNAPKPFKTESCTECFACTLHQSPQPKAIGWYRRLVPRKRHVADAMQCEVHKHKPDFPRLSFLISQAYCLVHIWVPCLELVSAQFKYQRWKRVPAVVMCQAMSKCLQAPEEASDKMTIFLNT